MAGFIRSPWNSMRAPGQPNWLGVDTGLQDPAQPDPRAEIDAASVATPPPPAALPVAQAPRALGMPPSPWRIPMALPTQAPATLLADPTKQKMIDEAAAARSQFGARSGGKYNNELDNLTRQTNQRQVGLWADPAQIAQTTEAISQIPAVQQQEQGNQLLRQLMELQASRNPALDVSPLLALADAQTGSHLAQNYQRPITGAQAMNSAVSMADKLQDNQRDTAKTYIDAIKGLKAGTDTQLLYNQLLEKTGAGFQDPMSRGSPTTAPTQFMTKSYNETKALRDNDEQLQKILVNVASFNPTAQRGVPMQIARMIEGARPAMAAAAIETGDQSLLERVNAMTDRVLSGKATRENVAQYVEMVKQMQGVNHRSLTSTIERLRAYGTQLGLAPEAMDQMLPRNWQDPYASDRGKIYRNAPKAKNIGDPEAKKAHAATGGAGGAPDMDAFLNANPHLKGK